MAATMTAPMAVANEAVARVIDERVLVPIQGLRPAGEDLRGLKLWVDLRAGRPKVEDASTDHPWQLANPVTTDWASYGEMVEQALCARSKDLELGLFLTEARTRVHGLAGVRDGLWMLGGLIEGFADRGLFPLADDGDLEAQYGKLEWLNEKFSDVVREVELTRRPEPPNYSLNYRDESRRQNGMISSAEFEAAAMAGSAEAYHELLGLIEEAKAELARLTQVVAGRYGEGVLSFVQIGETLTECRVTVQGIMRKRDVGADIKPHPNLQPVLQLPPSGPIVTGDEAQSGAHNAWTDCERLARSGQVDQALSGMAALAAAEPNGRIRFQRKLLLADLCLQTNRKKLGLSILQELNEIIEQHKLESWETSEVVGGVWARLVRCYRDKAAGTADEERESTFYLKLSRLDPWQALTCGEPARKE